MELWWCCQQSPSSEWCSCSTSSPRCPSLSWPIWAAAAPPVASPPASPPPSSVFYTLGQLPAPVVERYVVNHASNAVCCRNIQFYIFFSSDTNWNIILRSHSTFISSFSEVATEIDNPYKSLGRKNVSCPLQIRYKENLCQEKAIRAPVVYQEPCWGCSRYMEVGALVRRDPKPGIPTCM